VIEALAAIVVTLFVGYLIVLGLAYGACYAVLFLIGVWDVAVAVGRAFMDGYRGKRV
jgi:hypothetical protein